MATRVPVRNLIDVAEAAAAHPDINEWTEGPRLGGGGYGMRTQWHRGRESGLASGFGRQAG